MKLKYNLLKTKSVNEIKKNIEKIFDENVKIFLNTCFLNFLHCFFNEEEYYMLKLLKECYFYAKNNFVFFQISIK